MLNYLMVKNFKKLRGKLGNWAFQSSSLDQILFRLWFTGVFNTPHIRINGEIKQ